MEQEKILTGYCRGLDQSRMVVAEFENGQLTDIDCDYPHCPHLQSCPIAKNLSELTQRQIGIGSSNALPFGEGGRA